MPIYEYICQNCHTTFEAIRSFQEADSRLRCLKCNSEDVKRQISLFNASSSGRTLTTSGGCGSCTSSSCSTCGSK